MDTKFYYTQDDVDNLLIGSKGTPERDFFEQQLAEELHAYHVGEAIRKAREEKNITQEQLGERIGISKSQVCRLEKGKNITLTSMMRVFKALGVEVDLDMKGIGRMSLC